MRFTAVWEWFKAHHPHRDKRLVAKELHRRCTLQKGRWVWSGGWKQRKKGPKDAYAALRRATRNETQQGLAAAELLRMGAHGVQMQMSRVRDVLKAHGIRGANVKRWVAPACEWNKKKPGGVFRLPHPFLVGGCSSCSVVAVVGSCKVRLHKKLHRFYKSL